MKKRIFISSPRDIYLQKEGDNRSTFKHAVINEIERLGYETQFYNPGTAAGGRGMAEGKSWDHREVNEIIASCSGAVLIGFRYWDQCVQAGDSGEKTFALVSEYCQYEGAIARRCGIPVFLLLEKGAEKRIMFSSYSGEEIFEFPQNAGHDWLASSDFSIFLDRWLKKVNSRHDLFLGYCSKAAGTAKQVTQFLVDAYPGLGILDWTEFKQSSYILERVKEASSNCRAAIFIFSADEFLKGDDGNDQADMAIPRDNVLFEAGYFMHAKGMERVLIIAEANTKIPADLGGIIYAPLLNEVDASMQEKLRSFVEKNI